MKNTTRLQGIGICEGIQAKDLKAGMITVWNYGYKNKVVEIIPSKSGKTIKAKLEYKDIITGETKIAERKLKATRIVVVQ